MPPSVVAEPPQPTISRCAPADTAASISSPTPAVPAATGSLSSAPPASTRPAACDISMIAVWPDSPGRPASNVSSRQDATTGSPRGPVTVELRFGPPSTSRSPSPPSDIGSSVADQAARRAPAAMAPATAVALAVPLNLSGTASRCGTATSLPSGRVRAASRSAVGWTAAGQPRSGAATFSRNAAIWSSLALRLPPSVLSTTTNSSTPSRW